MKKIFTFLFAMLILTSAGSRAATVTVGATGTYSSISQAIAGVGTITEPLVIELTTDYAQTADEITAIAGASQTNFVTIRPQGALTVAGNGEFVWKMNGCQYVTIDGRVNGEGAAALTLRADTIVGNALLASPLLKKSSALYVTNSSDNVVKYVNFKGATSESNWRQAPTAAPTMGVVTFAAGTTNMTLDNCDLGPIDNIKGTPTVSLVSLGTVSSPNSGIVISNNKIYDYFPTDNNKCTTVPGTGVGVLMSDYTSNSTVSGNSFYKTYEHSSVGFVNNANARSCAIAVVNANGSGFVIRDNYIGGSAPLCAGTNYVADIRNNTAFNGIYVSTAASDTSFVYGNVIKNLMILSHSQVAQVYQCSGITVNGGLVYVGVKEDNTAAGNIIGDVSSSTTGASASIKFCGTNTNSAFTGIAYVSLAGGNVKIANNKVAGVTVNLFKDYALVRTTSFVGINILGTGASTMVIDNNQIGNNDTGIAPASMSVQNFMSRSNYGINVNPALPALSSLTISNNKINNIYHAQQTTTQTYNHGVFINTSVLCPVTISGNEIRDMVFTNGRVNDTPINWGAGIYCGSQGNASVISNNSVYNHSGLDAASVNVIGIQLNPTANTAVMHVSGNAVYNLSSNVTRKTGQYAVGSTGIFTHITGALTPTINVYNNMIRLGYDRNGNALTSGSLLTGVRDSLVSTNAAATARYYNNTIYIGGSNVAAVDTISSYGVCFATTGTSVTRDFKNNLIVNVRNNETTGASHYAIATGGSATAFSNFTSNRNNYYVNGNGAVLGRFTSGANAVTLANVQGYTLGDMNSNTEVPVFANATAATPDLHLVQDNIENGDLNFAEVLAMTTPDFDGNIRKESNPTVGADEYKGPQTNVEIPGNASINVYRTGDQLVVDGLLAGQLIQIYNANGQLIEQTLAGADVFTMRLKQGIYIVKTMKGKFKIVL